MGLAVELVNVTKSGEWYVIEGYVDGRRVSVDVPADRVEGRSRHEAHAVFRRALTLVANANLTEKDLAV